MPPASSRAGVPGIGLCTFALRGQLIQTDTTMEKIDLTRMGLVPEENDAAVAWLRLGSVGHHRRVSGRAREAAVRLTAQPALVARYLKSLTDRLALAPAHPGGDVMLQSEPLKREFGAG